MSQPVKVGLIYGSGRHGRFCDTVARWTEKELGSSGKFSVEVIDPMVHSQAARNVAITNDATTHDASNDRSLGTQLAEADAFVVVTPEYNHGYPAALKRVDRFRRRRVACKAGGVRVLRWGFRRPSRRRATPSSFRGIKRRFDPRVRQLSKRVAVVRRHRLPKRSRTLLRPNVAHAGQTPVVGHRPPHRPRDCTLCDGGLMP
jgi:hypothetical protein